MKNFRQNNGRLVSEFDPEIMMHFRQICSTSRSYIAMQSSPRIRFPFVASFLLHRVEVILRYQGLFQYENFSKSLKLA
jgi:hypothetical protein